MMIWGSFLGKAVPGHGLAPLPARGAAWRVLRPPCARSAANAEWTGEGWREKHSVAEHVKVFNDDLGCPFWESSARAWVGATPSARCSMAGAAPTMHPERGQCRVDRRRMEGEAQRCRVLKGI